jgi:hypothetical protein
MLLLPSLGSPVNFKPMLDMVRDKEIRFLTMRPAHSHAATLERRVVVTGPPELVALAQTPDPLVLEELVNVLRQPHRGWAAFVLLAAMTGREEKIVDSFASTPDEWYASLGDHSYANWSSWLEQVKHKLVWDAERGAFVESPE